jgi:ssDNA-binding Zn-finger/Zn-ribbon topoisomerase 1
MSKKLILAISGSDGLVHTVDSQLEGDSGLDSIHTDRRGIRSIKAISRCKKYGVIKHLPDQIRFMVIRETTDVSCEKCRSYLMEESRQRI